MPSNYDVNSIETKTQRDHVRMRTGMYLGDKIRNTALREVFDNSVDEVISGYGSNVAVIFHDDDSFEVRDSGRGVPYGCNAKGVSGIELALGNLNSGGKFSQKNYESGKQAGLNGVGSSATNMISSRFSVTVYSGDGKKHQLDFREGLPGHFAPGNYDVNAKFTPGHDVISSKDDRTPEKKATFPTGTYIRLTFDPKVASDDVFDKAEFLERIKCAPFLIENLMLTIVDVDGSSELITGDGGLRSMLSQTIPDEKLVGDVLHVSGHTSITRRTPTGENVVPIDYEVLIGWGAKDYGQTRLSFVDSVKTEKGVHESSFESALESAFAWKIPLLKILKNKESVPGLQDILEGSHTIISIDMPEPPFEGQDKHGLRGRDIYNALREAYEDSFRKWMSARPNQEAIQAIAQKTVSASRVREMQVLAKDNARKKVSKTEGSTLSLPDKYLACAERDNAELYICEGDSALSTVKAARNSRTQAAIPIRGKILQCFNVSPTAAMKNNEISSISQVIGAGIGKNFDLDKMNFDRIVLVADADFDGNHIDALLMLMFYSLMRPVIEDGRLYVALPPLFIIKEQKTGKMHYALDNSERTSVEDMLRKKKVRYDVTRAKGLGEMGPKEFSETVMDPATRSIKKVNLEDVEESVNALTTLFSNDTERRKKWIESERANYNIEDFDL